MTKLILSALFAGVLSLLAVAAPARAGEPLYYGLRFEEFEVRAGDEGESLRSWNANAFVGTDAVKLRWLGEGEYDANANAFEKLENRLAVQVPVSDFFDVKGGVRFDSPKGPNRKYGFVGLSGLAKQWFEIDADLFYSEKNNLSARVDVEYELLLTNHLILTPSLDVGVAFSDDAPIDVKSGVTGVEAGVRLSYDLVDRMVSPYVGGVYERKLGNTADFLRAEGQDVEGWRAVVGLKMLF